MLTLKPLFTFTASLSQVFSLNGGITFILTFIPNSFFFLFLFFCSVVRTPRCTLSFHCGALTELTVRSVQLLLLFILETPLKQHDGDVCTGMFVGP